jgi:purine-cytosine permease-like protein
MREETVAELERKIKKTGTQFGWFGVSFVLAGVILTILEASGAEVILAIGVLVAIQGVVIEYIFKS